MRIHTYGWRCHPIFLVLVAAVPCTDALFQPQKGCYACGGSGQLKTKNILQCKTMCDRHQGCSSVDYNIRTRECVLIDSITPYSTMCSYKEWLHVDVTGGIPPCSANRCDGSDCGTNEVCSGDSNSMDKCITVSSISSVQTPRDCYDIMMSGQTTSGVYDICLYHNETPIAVYCDMIDGGGWTVFQKRMDGSVHFYRNWADYENGFGNVDGEYWLGNRFINTITVSREYILRIDLEDFNSNRRYAEYEPFSIGDATTKYVLHVGQYSGDAGDSLVYHDGREFTTKDVDNDPWTGGILGNCANKYKGGWWYGACHHSNLNGLYLGGDHVSYADGIGWKHWKGRYYSYKITVMKIRPR